MADSFFDIGAGWVREIAAGIEASTPEAIAAAQVAAGAMTEAMAEQFLEDARAQEESQRLIERVGDTMLDEIERQRARIVDGFKDLLKAAEAAYDAVFDSINARFTTEDLRERISDAERDLADKRAELAEAQRTVAEGPAATAQAQRELDAAERAASSDSAALAAARRRSREADAALADARFNGSDVGFFQEKADAARRALEELEAAEKEREDEALAAARKRLAEVQSGVADAREALESLPEAVSDSETALKRAYLRLFEDMAEQGITPVGGGAAQSEMRRIGQLAGLTQDEMLQIALRAVDIRNAQNQLATVEQGRLTNEQVRQIADAVAAGLREGWPGQIVVDGGQLIGVISAYLSGGVAP